MKNLTDANTPLRLFAMTMRMLLCIAITAFITGCTTLTASTSEKKPEIITKSYPLTGDSNKPKSIFVFLDGTSNNPKSGTNVWRLYDSLSKKRDPQATGIYIEGVGNGEHTLLGEAFGDGMEDRILRGYSFITQNYHPDDKIYIFGFSRGAHEARALAGFLSYAGVPRAHQGNTSHLMEEILELVKDKDDADYLDKWILWKPKTALLSEEIKDKLKIEMQPTEITFLGVWDTVPGSSFKEYGDCKEIIGVAKKYFYWLPFISKGERYKSDTYPAIHHIAQAVSLDEKRDKFHPLLLCEPINSQQTTKDEMWFPGAHADVGGGYSDVRGSCGKTNDLSNISYNWMVGLLEKSYTSTPLSIVNECANNECAKGLAHWSIGDFPANIGSKCKDRVRPEKEKIHESFYIREKSSPVPILIRGEEQSLHYPIKCLDLEKETTGTGQNL